MTDISSSTPTTSVAQTEGEAIGKLAELIQKLIHQEEVTVAEREEAKATAAQLVSTGQDNLNKINQLIDTAAAATAA